MPEEPTIATELIYSGRILNLRIDTVNLPGGGTTRREIVEHVPAVALVALDAEENVLLVRQFRKPAESDLLEVPAGSVDPGEDPEAAARRELQEETGVLPGNLEHLATFFTAPGFSTELMHLYLATDLTPARLPADDDESIVLVRVPVGEIAELVSSGGVADAKTLVGLLLLLGRLGRPATRKTAGKGQA
ncbi:MAG: NUDIX hydrolase [Chloroflexota bacterium]|nr:NUDIX hydrolase [Chloroflexota bacterium]